MNKYKQYYQKKYEHKKHGQTNMYFEKMCFFNLLEQFHPISPSFIIDFTPPPVRELNQNSYFFLRIMTSLQVKLLETLSLSPGVLRRR